MLMTAVTALAGLVVGGALVHVWGRVWTPPAAASRPRSASDASDNKPQPTAAPTSPQAGVSLQAGLAQAHDVLQRLNAAAAQPTGAAQPQAASVEGLAVRLGHLAAQADELPATLAQFETWLSQSLGDNATLRSTIGEVARAYGQINARLTAVGPLFVEAQKLCAGVDSNLADLANMSRHARSRGVALEADWQGADEVLAQLTGALAEMQRSVVDVQDAGTKARLLSLNAAIVASQSGEHGRGFSVVAEQIKSLAQRTASAAQSMEAWIERIDGYKGQLSALSNQHGSMLSDSDGDAARAQERADAARAELGELQRLFTQSSAQVIGGSPSQVPIHQTVATLIDALMDFNAAVRTQTPVLRRAIGLAGRVQGQARALADVAQAHTSAQTGAHAPETTSHDGYREVIESARSALAAAVREAEPAPGVSPRYERGL